VSALIIRMPQEKCERLKQLARVREMSVNKLIDEVTTMLLAEFDAETRFRIRAAREAGKARRGLASLDKVAGSRYGVTAPISSRRAGSRSRCSSG
jgi:hypothetical protein